MRKLINMWQPAVAAFLLAATAAASTTTTLPLTATTTATLTTATKFFPISAGEEKTTLPQTSLVIDETSISQELITSPSHIVKATTAALAELAANDSTETKMLLSVGSSLPVKIDKSSTTTQLHQLVNFERQNRIAEAYLLACELVRQNPNAEFAYDAAIRTALVLGLNDDVEKYYQEAIKRSPLPGKYYVQYAHFLSRTGKAARVGSLISDHEKDQGTKQDYWISLARLYTIKGDLKEARTRIQKALEQKVVLFPLFTLATHLARELGDSPASAKYALDGISKDFGPWEKKALLYELLKTPEFKTSDLLIAFRAAMANETDYERAKAISDVIIEQLLKRRLFYNLWADLSRVIATGEATDIEIWLASRMALHAGDVSRAVELLTTSHATSTPVIAYERAIRLAETGNAAEAIPILRGLLGEQPTRVPLRLALVEELAKSGETTESLNVLSPIQGANITASERAKYCELVTSASVATGDAQRVLEFWVELSEIASFSDQLAMGDILLVAMKDESLRKELEQKTEFLLEKPSNWPLLLMRARFSSFRNDHDIELSSYREYLEHEWTNVPMLRFVADLAVQYSNLPITLENGKPSQRQMQVAIRATDTSGTALAIELYRRLIELQPEIPDHYSALMRAFQMRGEVETAKKVAIELAQRDRKSPQLQRLAGSILEENGFTSDALVFYQNALKLDPSDYDTWIKYAAALARVEEYKEAGSIYRKLLEDGIAGKPYNQPQLFAAMLKLASDSGHVPELVRYLGSLRDKPIPGKEEFYLSASKLCMQIKADEAAHQFLNDFIQTHPESRIVTDAYLLLGQLYYSRRQSEEALKVYRYIAANFPRTDAAVTAAFNMGEVHKQERDYHAAVNAWQAVAESNPTSDRALSGLYEAALTAYTDLQDPKLSSQLLDKFIASGSQDFKLLRKSREMLARIGDAPTTQVAAAP